MDSINSLGVYIDCSRNAVITVSAMKKFFDVIRSMGYNSAMIYTEDTFELDEYPEFGYMRGRYTKEELKEIVAYGEKIGIGRSKKTAGLLPPFPHFFGAKKHTWPPDCGMCREYLIKYFL